MAISALDQSRMEVALKFENWRAPLLSPAALAKLAKELNLGWFSVADITGLWSIGLLRADFITSETPIDIPGLIRLDAPREVFEYSYCDNRKLEHQEKGLGSALKDHNGEFFEESLFFHPSRIYILHHVERTLKISTSNMQFLRYEPGVHNVVKTHLESSVRWTSSISFIERFHYWNQVAETAAVVEPLVYDYVFRDRPPLPIATPLKGGFEDELSGLLTEIGKTHLQNMLADLAFAAVTLDENRHVHVLMRLMKWRERERLKGYLGAAMHFLAMAECIRRSSERTFNESWPEEDEIGPGQWMDGARKTLYGNERVFDAPRSDLRDYLSQLGLDFGIKVRCYVEGDTEFGALAHAVGNFDHAQLINLSGNFAEKRGKGLAFSESLQADKLAGIFSIVVIDGDVEAYPRILRKAADEGKFHGRFFINEPDIECANFSCNELIETAIQESEKNCAILTDFTSIRKAMLAQASSIFRNGDLISLSKANGLTQLRKSGS